MARARDARRESHIQARGKIAVSGEWRQESAFYMSCTLYVHDVCVGTFWRHLHFGMDHGVPFGRQNQGWSR